jgi:hypothetical protein
MHIERFKDEWAVWVCDCGTRFEVDATTEENLHFNGKRLVPQCPTCHRLETDKPPLYLRMLAPFIWVLLIGFHFTVCTVLTIIVHPERKRYKYYEYYQPWGWGKQKDCPHGETEPDPED